MQRAEPDDKLWYASHHPDRVMTPRWHAAGGAIFAQQSAADLVAVGVPVFLSAHGKLGSVLGAMRLNDRLISAAQSCDTQRLRRELATARDACLAYPGLAKTEEGVAVPP